MKTALEYPKSLIYVSDNEAGFTRLKCGRGFKYLDHSGMCVSCKKEKERIKNLVIPPMWSEVWICKEWSGHIQVTGFDEKGRKQYIYHPEWTAHRQKSKYDKLQSFGQHLPFIREQVKKDLRQRSWSKRKILATTIELLDSPLHKDRE